MQAKDRIDLMSACVRSILDNTDYAPYELLILDSGSSEPNVLSWMQSMAHEDRRVRIVPAPVPSNWPRLNNLGATAASGQVLIFLNGDTEVLSRDWMQRLAENALRPGIGACGPLLLYGDGSIQHAGVVVGLGGCADHVFKGSQAVHDQRLFVSPVLRRNVLAVTGACMAIAAETFGSLGGFDDSFVCGSDVAICLRAHRQGLWNLYLPEVRLTHHESKTHVAYDMPAVDFMRSADEYGRFRNEGDPLYNPNLDLMSLIPELRSPR
jgi:O-antigen biosynthesis protein